MDPVLNAPKVCIVCVCVCVCVGGWVCMCTSVCVCGGGGVYMHYVWFELRAMCPQVKDVNQIALEITTMVWEKEGLRDELFIQLCRQTSSNSNP